jgi:tyrosinase
MKRLIIWLIGLIALAAKGDAVTVTGPQAGVNAATGERPFRQEFSVFQNSGPAFDLYIQALYYFMQDDQSNVQSYFQIAAIHGFPFRSWDGVEGDFQAGYCTHGSTLFPPWHRPYLALFEQILWDYAQIVAATYPESERGRYEEAARTLRIPYWDWAVNPRMPDLVNSPIVTVNLPSGLCNCPNPLYEYVFNPLPSDPDFPDGTRLNRYNRTVRSPNLQRESQPELSNRLLEANAESLKTLTYQLIASQPDYAPFSNTAHSDGRGGRYNNLENLHNAVHSFIGNGGHMSNIPYSSFDPVFWLHHANIDRIFAIWQAVHPTSYVTQQVNEAGTFTQAPGSMEDINTPLTPFRADDSGTFYTSVTARSTRPFGYSYPEIVDWGVSESQLTSEVRRRVNALYNPTGSIAARSTTLKRSNTTDVTSNAADHQWLVNIRVDRSSLPTSFYIHFFLGEVPAASETWGYAPDLVASHAVMAPVKPVPGAEYLSYGQIPLTSALLASPAVYDLTPECVRPVLKDQLKWRIQDFDGHPIDVERVPSLKLYVAGQDVHQWGAGSPDKLPVFDPLIGYRNITRGKAGGLPDEDPF